MYTFSVTRDNPPSNSEAREWRHDSDKTQTNKLEWWTILKISLRPKAIVPKTLVKRKLHLHSLYFPQNALMLNEFRGEFSNLRAMFRLPALRSWGFVIYCASLFTFYLFLCKTEPTVYKTIAIPSREARQLGWAIGLASAGRLTLAGEATFFL